MVASTLLRDKGEEWKKKLPAEGAAGGAGFDTDTGFFSSGGDTFKYKMTINKPTWSIKIYEQEDILSGLFQTVQT